MRLSYGRHDNSHTCSAAATKLFDFELSLVIISPLRTVVLAIVFTV